MRTTTVIGTCNFVVVADAVVTNSLPVNLCSVDFHQEAEDVFELSGVHLRMQHEEMGAFFFLLLLLPCVLR